MGNLAAVIFLINMATLINSIEPPVTTQDSILYRNNETGIVGNLLITRRGNYTHLSGCDDRMKYCDFIMDTPNRAMHVVRNSDLARCDPVIFMHSYEYIGMKVSKVIVHDRK